jgi:hypothetical protein
MARIPFGPGDYVIKGAINTAFTINARFLYGID